VDLPVSGLPDQGYPFPLLDFEVQTLENTTSSPSPERNFLPQVHAPVWRIWQHRNPLFTTLARPVQRAPLAYARNWPPGSPSS